MNMYAKNMMYWENRHHTSIATLCQPVRHSCEIISLEDIVEVCIYMKFVESSDAYTAHFVNHVKRD